MVKLAVALALLHQAAPASAEPGREEHSPASSRGREVIEAVCLECHGGRRPRAGFDLAAMLDRRPLAAGLFDWRRARAIVESQAMPPADTGEAGLDAEDRLAVLAFVDEIEVQAYDLGGTAGFEPVRRLTRGELARSLSSLLGVSVHVDGVLPEELISENGFASDATTLDVHADWLGRARSVVRDAVRRAVPDEGRAMLAPTLDWERFLVRAFRRPPTDDEIARYARGLADRRAAGVSARMALRETLGEVLASPHFLMRLEDIDVAEDRGRAGEPGERRVGEYGLASRLSFLLWAAPPDEPLLSLARSGALSEGLESQVERMLVDSRARWFGSEFGGQWLGTHALGTRIKPDPIDNPDMTDSMLAAMREEVGVFVLMLFAEDRPLDDLFLADVTTITPELARFYGQELDAGVERERVRLVDARRRGILGKAGVLVATSYYERTSPVLRGAWILDELLGTPPPPPPPGVGELDFELFGRTEAPGLRGVLEAHRAAPACTSCHARIDPLGFALEGFDRFGRTRRVYADGSSVDTEGTLPSGARFRGPTALARVLLEERRGDLALEVTRRLLRFALARPLTWEDERTVVDLARVLDRDGFGALLRGVVASRPFLYVGAG